MHRGQDIECVRALVLGDVGTKVDGRDVKARPSWAMVTSASNYQLGILLDWTCDLAGVAALNAGVHLAGPAAVA